MSSRSLGSAIGSNPFSTKFIRAGALPYRFSKGESLERFRNQLQCANWRGQIVGPHGSGKTTLLRTLDEHWNRWGRRPIVYTLHNGQRRIHGFPKQVAANQIIVDGFEQLSVFSQCRLVASCHLRRCGLLVTTHKPIRWLSQWLPVVKTTSTSIALAEDLVARLLQNHLHDQLTSFGIQECVNKSFQHHAGNLRETFLSLYDEYAQVMPSDRATKSNVVDGDGGFESNWA